MSRSVSFRVLGLPRTKNAKKAFRRGDRAILTDDKKTKEAQASFAAAAQAHAPETLLSGPLAVSIVFAFPVGKGSKWQRNARHAGAQRKSTRPDLENLVKLVNDAMTGVIFVDDAQVVELTVSKRYEGDVEGPGTFVYVRELDDVTTSAEWVAYSEAWAAPASKPFTAPASGDQPAAYVADLGGSR